MLREGNVGYWCTSINETAGSNASVRGIFYQADQY